MAIIDQTIRVYVGEAVALDFTMTPVEDISGWTLAFTVTRALGSATKKIQQAATVTNGPLGTFTVPLTALQTDHLPATYHYDVWRVDAGSERLLAIGDFELAVNARQPTA